MKIVKHTFRIIIDDFISDFCYIFICAEFLYFGKPDLNGIIGCCIVTAVCDFGGIKSRFSYFHGVRIEHLHMVKILLPKSIYNNGFAIDFSSRIFNRYITFVTTCDKSIIILERKFKILVFLQIFIGSIQVKICVYHISLPCIFVIGKSVFIVCVFQRVIGIHRIFIDKSIGIG